MGYFQGFVIPVKKGEQAAYRRFAAMVAPGFSEHGALRTVECWGDNVMVGKTTDFRRAVAADDGEEIVFAWIEWPDRATCDAAAEKMTRPDGPVPFDMQRMIYAGYDLAFATGPSGAIGYVDGIVAAVPDGARADFVEHSQGRAAIFLEKGATRVVEGWGADVPAGKITDFQRAVQAKAGETVVCGWIEWPDKSTRDAGMTALMQDERLRANPAPWNGQLAIFGGFTPILDTDNTAS